MTSRSALFSLVAVVGCGSPQLPTTSMADVSTPSDQAPVHDAEPADLPRLMDVPTRVDDSAATDATMRDGVTGVDATALDGTMRDGITAVDVTALDGTMRDGVTAVDVSAERVRPALTATWHIDLEVPVDTSVDASWYDIDLFDNSDAVVRAIHARGSRVVCYFSAGSGENWRPDYSRFPTAALGTALDGWPGERWLDVRAEGVRGIMRARMDLAVRNGCDGVDPDNVDGYANANGFRLTAADQLAYNRFLAREAHARGLVVGLKNDVEQIGALLADFDFAINEQCIANEECDAVAAFTRASKSVLHIEYGPIATLTRTACPRGVALRFFSILSEVDRLNGTYTRCTH